MDHERAGRGAGRGIPAGDGTVETEATVLLSLLRGDQRDRRWTRAAASHQEYVEDCQVCCRPWRVVVTYLPDGTAEVVGRGRALE